MVNITSREEQKNEDVFAAKTERLRELTELLSKASRAYYQESREIMTNYEYDRLYDELLALEKETGTVLAGSPTVNVGYEVVSQLPKEAHPSKMLSLDKTKEPERLAEWLGDKDGLLSWKLDGLTIVLTYRDGVLFKAVTRGNGEIGEVVTGNAKAFVNLPLSIDFKGELVLRGEAVISYEDFKRINEAINDDGAKYKNPRNLCSGSVRQLNSRITAQRSVRFYAFALVSAEGLSFSKRREQMDWLRDRGFKCVTERPVTAGDIMDNIAWFADNIKNNQIPSDGLVLIYDDIEYGRSLGSTSKFPRDAIAFKWQDEMQETTLKEVEWNASRTGLINPIAVFEPVELEGTTVSRASVHNISVMQELALGIGDRIRVYKANMIIPQISENLSRSNNVKVPCKCPVCGRETKIRDENGVKTLHCLNLDCLAKQIKKLTLFVSRDAMNIEGLSEMTIEKLVAAGLVHELSDLFHIENFRKEILNMEGFGQKSFDNLIESAEKAKDTTPARLLYSLGIPGIGKANAALIARACDNKWHKIQSLTAEELTTIEGIGEVVAQSFKSYFDDAENQKTVADLLSEVRLDEREEERGDALSGLTFVITGSLNHYENREALKAEIEKAGGRTAGSVSAKTDYLINNDVNSGSGKNKKARELGVPILSEEQVMEWLRNGRTEFSDGKY